MLGSFSQKSLELFQEQRSESLFSDFSEGDFYDFTTCIRPDGSAYGTGGKCRKGTEGEAKEPKPSGKTRPKAAIESDMRKLTSSGAMQQRGLVGVKARAEHARLKAELNKPAQKKAETPYRVSQEDVDRTKKIIDGEKQKLQNLNDSIKKNPELGKDPEVQKQRKASEATVKSYYESLAYILDRQAAENKQAKKTEEAPKALQTDSLKTEANNAAARSGAFGSKKFQDGLRLSPSNPNSPNFDPKTLETPKQKQEKKPEAAPKAPVAAKTAPTIGQLASTRKQLSDKWQDTRAAASKAQNELKFLTQRLRGDNSPEAKAQLLKAGKALDKAQQVRDRAQRAWQKVDDKIDK